MAENTHIQWADHTWNPWHGCKKVSPGCKNCYMYRDKKRYGHDPMAVKRSTKRVFNAPLREKEFTPGLVFTCSWSDFFTEEADEWRDEAWDIIQETPHLTYLILTKRPERILECLPRGFYMSPWHNVWLGVSVENNDYLYRVDILREIPAAVRFISAEPLLANLDNLNVFDIDWVITGGESGKGAREAKLDWFRAIRDKCLDNNVAYFHKQHGGSTRIDGAWGGCLLDGKLHNDFPTLK